MRWTCSKAPAAGSILTAAASVRQHVAAGPAMDHYRVRVDTIDAYGVPFTNPDRPRINDPQLVLVDSAGYHSVITGVSAEKNIKRTELRQQALPVSR